MKTSMELISDSDNALMADCLGITTEDRMRNLFQQLIQLLAHLPQMLDERKKGCSAFRGQLINTF